MIETTPQKLLRLALALADASLILKDAREGIAKAPGAVLAVARRQLETYDNTLSGMIEGAGEIAGFLVEAETDSIRAAEGS